MLKLQTRKLESEFNDKKYMANFPSVHQLKDYSVEYDKEEDKTDVVINFLVKLGLPSEVVSQFEMDHLTLILEELSSSKK